MPSCEYCFEIRGDIPKSRKYSIPTPCHIKHPGVCRTKDALFYGRLDTAGTCLRHEFLRKDVERIRLGAFYVFCGQFGDHTTHEVYAVLANRRWGGPKLVVFAACSLAGDIITIDASLDEIEFGLNTTVLLDFFKKERPNSSLNALEFCLLEVRSMPDVLGKVRLCGRGEAVPFYPPQARVMQRKDKVDKVSADLAARLHAGLSSLPGGVPSEGDEDHVGGDVGVDSDNSENTTGHSDASAHTSEDSEVEEGESGDSEPEKSTSEEPMHYHWWVTRSRYQAQCHGCKAAISPHTMRASFYPDSTMVPDRRKWGQAWWRNYHIAADCLSSNHSQEAMMRQVRPRHIQLDCTRLPARFAETDEQFRSSKESACADLVAAYAEFMERAGGSSQCPGIRGSGR